MLETEPKKNEDVTEPKKNEDVTEPKKNEDVKPKKDVTEPKPKKNADTVEIKKADYDKLMAQLERNAKDIDLLYKATDKHRMSKALGDGGEILVKKVNIWTWDDTGKIVVASKLITNKSEIILGKWYEDQSVDVVFEDGEVITVPYLEFKRRTLNKIPAEIISTTNTRDDKNQEVKVFKVQFSNGKTLEINSSFVN